MTADAFPLAWPAGWPRTPDAERVDGKYHFRRPVAARVSPFWTFAEARDALLDELRRLGAADVMISSNFKPDRTGKPVEPNRRPLDQGVAIYFTLAGKPKAMARDTYARAEENFRSLALTIEHLRGVERHGGGMMLDRAFDGFTALPPPLVTPAARAWWDVLNVPRGAGRDEIEAAFKRAAKAAHPDLGGSEAAMREVNAARAAALGESAA